jgi:uncharacterized membrane protein
MTGNEFISNLRKHIKGLPQAEIDAATQYYSEYISDAGAENEEETVAALGDPSAVAATIIAEFAVKPETPGAAPVKRGPGAVWFVLLAVFAAPIGLPLAIAFAAVVLALLIVVIAFVISFGAAAVSLVVSGIAGIILGVAVLTQSLPTTLLTAGAGLACLGAGILFAWLTAITSKYSFRGLSKLVGRFILRRAKR